MNVFRNQLSHVVIGEKNFSVSRTIPDQVMSVGEILQRYVRGQSIDAVPPVYTESDLVPVNWERMDEIERIEYTRTQKKFLKEAVGRIQAEKTTDAVSAPETSKRVEPVD